MIKSTFRILALTLSLLLLVSFSVMAGGSNRAGTASGTQLLIPVGAKSMGMGGANVASVNGVEAIFWNPAGVSRSTNVANVMFSHMTYIADINVSYAAVEAGFGDLGRFGLSVKSLGIGDIPVTTVESPDGTGANFSPTFMTIGLTYSKLLTDKISVGTNVKIFSEQVPRAGATGFAFDAGVQYAGLGGVEGLNFGISINNLGPEVTWDGTALNRTAKDPDAKRPTSQYKLDAASFELPTFIEMGLSYNLKVADAQNLNTTFVFQNNNFYDDETKVGAEYGFNNMFFLRGGYSYGVDVNEGHEYIYGPSFGAGFNYNFGNLDMQVDYAYRTVDIFDANHVFAFTLGF
ncbi:PorV/PorQ family protein [candidate division KSB1 bacterium]|nr:PorV/PorQ family protein [candidate division KSB1 bacterium]